MNAASFRRCALAFPETVEGAHRGHPDFRVGKKVFATLGPDETWAMVKIAPELQAACVEEDPAAFEAFAGAWGRQGCTKVVLGAAQERRVAALLEAAFRRVAPKRLLALLDGE